MIEMIIGTISNFCNSMESCEKCPFSQDIIKKGYDMCIFREVPEKWDSELIEKCYIEMCVMLYRKDRDNEEKK